MENIERISDVALRISLLWRLNTRRRIKRLDRNKRGAESKSFTGRSCEVVRSFFPFFLSSSFLLSLSSPVFSFSTILRLINRVDRESCARFIHPLFDCCSSQFFLPLAQPAALPPRFFSLSPLAYCFFVIGKQLTIDHRPWYTNSSEQRTRLRRCDEFICARERWTRSDCSASSELKG